MDHDFSNAEVLYIYILLKKEEERFMDLKTAGHSALVKSDLKIVSGILKKIETMYPKISEFPL